MKRWIAPGLLGSLLVAAGGSVVGTHPTVDLPAWLGYTTAYVGLTLLVATWLALGAALRAGADLGPAAAGRLLVAWAVPLAVGAPLYSRDAYSYVAQGRLAELGLNPYRYGPVRLGPGPYLDAVGHIWTRTHAPYGPLFVAVESLVVRVSPTVTSAAFGMRLAALAGLGLMAVALPRLARQHGVDERIALWLGLLNPLVLLHLVGGAHNDALMLGLLLAGLLLAGDGRPTTGLLLCTLAAAVKVPAILGVAYVGADIVARRRHDAWRVVALAGGTFVALTSLTGFGWGWVLAVGTPGRVHTLLSPSTAVGSVLERLGAGPGAVTISRTLGVLAAVVVLALLVALRGRMGSYRTLALSLLALVVLGPVVQPWYLLWGLVLLAGTGPGPLLALAVWTSTVLPFLVLPDGTSATDVVLLVFLVLTGALAWWTVRSTLPAAELG